MSDTKNTNTSNTPNLDKLVLEFNDDTMKSIFTFLNEGLNEGSSDNNINEGSSDNNITNGAKVAYLNGFPKYDPYGPTIIFPSAKSKPSEDGTEISDAFEPKIYYKYKGDLNNTNNNPIKKVRALTKLEAGYFLEKILGITRIGSVETTPDSNEGVTRGAFFSTSSEGSDKVVDELETYALETESGQIINAFTYTKDLKSSYDKLVTFFKKPISKLEVRYDNKIIGKEIVFNNSHVGLTDIMSTNVNNNSDLITFLNKMKNKRTALLSELKNILFPPPPPTAKGTVQPETPEVVLPQDFDIYIIYNDATKLEGKDTVFLDYLLNELNARRTLELLVDETVFTSEEYKRFTKMFKNISARKSLEKARNKAARKTYISMTGFLGGEKGENKGDPKIHHVWGVEGKTREVNPANFTYYKISTEECGLQGTGISSCKRTTITQEPAKKVYKLTDKGKTKTEISTAYTYNVFETGIVLLTLKEVLDSMITSFNTSQDALKSLIKENESMIGGMDASELESIQLPNIMKLLFDSFKAFLKDRFDKDDEDAGFIDTCKKEINEIINTLKENFIKLDKWTVICSTVFLKDNLDISFQKLANAIDSDGSNSDGKRNVLTLKENLGSYFSYGNDTEVAKNTQFYCYKYEGNQDAFTLEQLCFRDRSNYNNESGHGSIYVALRDSSVMNETNETIQRASSIAAIEHYNKLV